MMRFRKHIVACAILAPLWASPAFSQVDGEVCMGGTEIESVGQFLASTRASRSDLVDARHCTIYLPVGEHKLTKAQRRMIRQFSRSAGSRIISVGSTDQTGTEALNKTLAAKRAQAGCDALPASKKASCAALPLPVNFIWAKDKARFVSIWSY